MIAFLERPGLEGGSTGIWVLPSGLERKPTLFLESRFSLTHPEFSPDGRWMAYVSNESGAAEGLRASLPWSGREDSDLDGRRESSRCGPRPAASSSTAPAPVEPGVFLRGHPLPVSVSGRYASPAVRGRRPREYGSTTPVRGWDVSADGQRFLLLRPVESTDRPVTMMHVVMHWAEELKRLVPAK